MFCSNDAEHLPLFTRTLSRRQALPSYNLCMPHSNKMFRFLLFASPWSLFLLLVFPYSTNHSHEGDHLVIKLVLTSVVSVNGTTFYNNPVRNFIPSVHNFIPLVRNFIPVKQFMFIGNNVVDSASSLYIPKGAFHAK
jgi:hypothetical protein